MTEKGIRKIWLTADTHFNHKKLIEYCDRPEDYEERILRGFQEIHHSDLLIHLGDICVGGDAQVHDDIIKKIPCRKWLVRGNHDHKTNNWYLRNGWDFVATAFESDLFGKRVLFTHAPRFQSVEYDCNIHGHMHRNTWEMSEPTYHRCISLEERDYCLTDLEKILSGIEKTAFEVDIFNE